MRRLRLKDLGRWYSGGTPPRENEQVWAGAVPWISAKDIDRYELREPTAFVTREAALEFSRLVPEASLLLIVRGMALAHGIPVVQTNREVAFNQDLRALVCGSAVYSRFAYYALIGARSWLARHIDRAAHGTARVTDSLFAERIPLPDRERQIAIAELLERECARIRELEIVFERYAATLESQWLQRFERAAADEPRERRLKHFGAELSLGPFGSLLSADEYVSGGVPLINPVHINWRGLRPDDAVTVTPEAAKSLRRYQLHAGDVVTARRGELGRSAVVAAGEEGYLCGTGSARIRLSDRLRPEFLVLMLMTNRAKAHVLLTAVGSTMPNLKSEAFLDLRLPAWDVSEQDAAMNEALEAYRVMDGLIAEVKAAKIAVDEYRDALITEAVTGRLEVSSLSESQLDESAHAASEGKRPEVLPA